MEQDFYYANIDLTVRLIQSDCGVIDSLSDKEILVLQQQIYLTLSTFLHTRAIFSTPEEPKGGG